MAAYWEIAAHSAYDMLSQYKHLNVNLVLFPPRFLEWEFLSDCIIVYLYFYVLFITLRKENSVFNILFTFFTYQIFTLYMHILSLIFMLFDMKSDFHSHKIKLLSWRYATDVILTKS